MANNRAEKIDLRVPSEVKRKLTEIAREKQELHGKTVYPSDIVRDALTEYFKNNEIDISIDVNRGGNRRMAV